LFFINIEVFMNDLDARITNWIWEIRFKWKW
jgi:hypothetical protein